MATRRTALLACAGSLMIFAAVWAAEPPFKGDANGDNVVDFADYQILEANFGTGTTWQQGDFDGDADVDFADYQLLEINFGRRRLGVDVTIQNTTGSDKTNWPVFLTIWKVFGGNLDFSAVNSAGVHVYDPSGNEVSYMLRAMPPDWSLGNDELVFVVPSIASGASQTYRVTNTEIGGTQAPIDLIGNVNNKLPNGGFESGAGVPTGYTVSANNGTTIDFDAAEKYSGSRSLRLTMPVGASFTLKTTANISYTAGRPYHFSIWAKCDNLAYNGYGMYGCGGWFKHDSAAFTGRTDVTLKGDRGWYCYRFDSGANDSWGIPMQGPAGTATQSTKFNIAGYQQNQLFLRSPKTGRMWVDEALLFEQPVVTVDRAAPLARIASQGAVVYSRPVEMPRSKACSHEAVSTLHTFALRGQRREVRFGVHAVNALTNVQVELTNLAGPGSAIVPELEQYVSSGGNDFIGEYAAGGIAAGSGNEYLLGLEVPGGQAPGKYVGNVVIRAGGAVIRSVPVELEVLPLNEPSLDGYWLGGIYNIGFPLDRNDEFYRCYGKARFNYLMLFDYFCTHMDQMGQDFAYAQQQVDKLASLAHLTGGIGLYREPNMSEDQPRMWYQMATGTPTYPGAYKGTNPIYKTGYQDYAQACENYATGHSWPKMIYMVSDEPDRAADKVDYMGWLNERLPNAITCCDAQFNDMIQTWQWYNLPLIDDPADWSGPFIYDYLRLNKGRFGFCGVADGLEKGRYQAGLMMASSGACYWHWWHTQKVIQVVNGKVLRMQSVAAMGGGMNDFRYWVLLKELIDLNRGGPKDALANEAAGYLSTIFAFANADNDRHLLPYNGTPYTWGDDRWYDNWQRRMKDYIVRLAP